MQQRGNHRCKEYTAGAKGEGLGEGWNRRLELTDISYYIQKRILKCDCCFTNCFYLILSESIGKLLPEILQDHDPKGYDKFNHYKF